MSTFSPAAGPAATPTVVEDIEHLDASEDEQPPDGAGPENHRAGG